MEAQSLGLEPPLQHTRPPGPSVPCGAQTSRLGVPLMGEHCHVLVLPQWLLWPPGTPSRFLPSQSQ